MQEKRGRPPIFGQAMNNHQYWQRYKQNVRVFNTYLNHRYISLTLEFFMVFSIRLQDLDLKRKGDNLLRQANV